MYEEYYGFKEKPFSLLPDPAFLYLSRQHSMAFAMLEYGITNQSPITVITGEVGAGKTTLIRHLLNRLDEQITVGLVTNTHESFGNVLQWVLLAFGLEAGNTDKATNFKQFMDFLVTEYASGRRVLLIFDEAQNMTLTALEEVRLLSNINADKDHVLQLVLVGQPELQTKLQDPRLKQFVQRVAVAYHLKPLSQADTRGYITHRIKMSGGSPELFTDSAIETLYRESGGVPRLVNTLADTALVYGYAEQAAHIDADVIEEVLRDRHSIGTYGPRLALDD